MRLLVVPALLAALVVPPPVLGSGNARVVSCAANLLNTTQRSLALRKASSRPAWNPFYRPQPSKTLDPATLVYWTTPAGPHGCWSRVTYHAGRRVVTVTVDARKGHPRRARCTQRGFHGCRVIRKILKAPNVILAVTLT